MLSVVKGFPLARRLPNDGRFDLAQWRLHHCQIQPERPRRDFAAVAPTYPSFMTAVLLVIDAEHDEPITGLLDCR
jgi:hypothetical protein